ncbi:hypothetical protein [Actinoplanes sp. NPDC089786]|uniref:hypothetical protein n=1 Tax=Actinoplanes sp. NPDC089786 TaxID=3155185 RepID=UPI00343BB205
MSDASRDPRGRTDGRAQGHRAHKSLHLAEPNLSFSNTRQEHAAKRAFLSRLGDDWSDVADVLSIPLDTRRTFARGEEPRRIWDWLEDRNRLGDLPSALREADRADLAEEFGPGRTSPYVVITRFESGPRETNLREVYDDILEGLGSGTIEVEDGLHGRADFHFVAHRADLLLDVGCASGAIDRAVKACASGTSARATIILIGPVGEREDAMRVIDKRLGSGTPPHFYLQGVEDHEEMRQLISKLVEQLVGRRTRRSLRTRTQDPRDPDVGGY